jgi:hypothetical protein
MPQENPMRLALAACLIAMPALAYEPATNVAVDLAGILGSEEACDLVINPDAVKAYIAERVDPAVIDFASDLRTLSQGAAYNIGQLSPVALVAHCEAVKRSAAHYGLIE